ncbi:MAG: hypothetical protein ABIF40_00050 [archaeon]
MSVDFPTLQKFFRYDSSSSYSFLQLGDDFFKMRISKTGTTFDLIPDLNDRGIPRSSVSYEKVIGYNGLPILEEINKDSDLHRKLDKWVFQRGLLNVQKDLPVPSALKDLDDVLDFYGTQDWAEAMKIYDKILEDSLDNSFDE